MYIKILQFLFGARKNHKTWVLGVLLNLDSKIFVDEK